MSGPNTPYTQLSGEQVLQQSFNENTDKLRVEGTFTGSSEITNINLDAFGRLKTSTPYTLGDYKHLYSLNSDFIDNNSNGGTVTFQSNKSCARLATTNNPASKAIHQTRLYHHYLPGKSQLILSSFTFYTAVNNVTKRTGYFDDRNGIFLEQTGLGVLNIVLRSYTQGFVSETRVPQSSWNVDACDGDGASNFNIDITKTQLLFIDFQWLGVGRIRVGFEHNGQYITAHEFNGTNNLDVVYMTTPNLPVRCEILNTGATAGTYFDQICASVASEGGYVEAGLDWATISPSVRALASGATLPILAIRLKNTFSGDLNRMIARLNTVNIFSDSGNIEYYIVKLPNIASLTGGPGTWTTVNTLSGVEYYSTATGYSNAEILDVGYCTSAVNGGNKSGGTPTSMMPSSAKKNYISQNYDSTDSQIYCVVAKNIDTKSTNVSVGIQWREIY